MRKLTDTEHQIIKDWQQAEYAAKQREEVWAAGLYYESLGINTYKPYTAWRRPVTIFDAGQEKSFLPGIRSANTVSRGNGNKAQKTVVQIDDSEFE